MRFGLAAIALLLLAGCGGGGEETSSSSGDVTDHAATVTEVSYNPNTGGTTGTVPSGSTTGGAPAAGRLNRTGLTATFSDEFNAWGWNGLLQNGLYNSRWRPLVWQSDADEYWSRTLHEESEDQYYADESFLAARGMPASLTPFSVVDNGSGGKALRISARKITNAQRDVLAAWGNATGAPTPAAASKQWISGSITTLGTFRQQYGVWEARVRLPAQSSGRWPAFWMIADDGAGNSVWPPEIDIFDNYPLVKVGDKDRWHSGGIITPDSGFNGSPEGTVIPGLDTSQWNTITIEWNATNIVYYSNDVEYLRVKTPANFNRPMYPIFNLAIIDPSGEFTSWARPPASADTRYDFDIDWIRVWKRN